MSQFLPFTDRNPVPPAVLGVGGYIPSKSEKPEKYQESGDRGGTEYLILISALIFVTVIAIFEILRTIINNYYAKKSLKDPRSGNTVQVIQRTEIANENNLRSIIMFALAAIIISGLLIPILNKLR